MQFLKKSKIIFCVIMTALVTPLLTQAETISINPGIPGVSEATDLVGIVVNIFQTALLVGAFLAFGSIVYGAVTYALSESGFMKSEAKDRIIDALIGLTLLVGAYMLLYVINPALTILKNPGLEKIAIVVEGTIPRKPGSGNSRCQSNTPGCEISAIQQKCPAWKDVSVATQMSKICSIESGGSGVCSGSDHCSLPDGRRDPGHSFSCGIWQINMIAHQDKLPSYCKNLFTSQGSCVKRNIRGICIQWSCQFKGNEKDYNDCVTKLNSDSDFNFEVACKIYESQKYGAWQTTVNECKKQGIW
jgi:hypothetical protein